MTAVKISAISLLGVVPSLQELWLGQETKDSHSRMTVFLSCLDFSHNSLVLNQDFVTVKHFLMACVLR